MALGQPNINGYLKRVANHLLLKDQQGKAIQKQIRQLRYRLNREFKGQVTEISVFGSYARKTALSPENDPEVDVDLLIVFSDRGLQPQTYLERLKRFAEAYYPRSLSRRDHPAVVLNLAGMKFELVPAVVSFSLFPYKIPARGRLLTDWRRTDPKKFNDELAKANKKNTSLVKPLIRCLKYWNATMGWPFVSYDLETHIVHETVNRFFRWKELRTLQDFFYAAISDLNERDSDGGLNGDELTEQQTNAIKLAKSIIEETRTLERQPYSQVDALVCFQRMLPEPWVGQK